MQLIVSSAGVRCHPSEMKVPAILLAAMVVTIKCGGGAAQQSEDFGMESLSTDARILLQEADWAEAFGWNSSTSMCQWSAVKCDNSNTSVTDL